jgi:hypothetical protein
VRPRPVLVLRLPLEGDPSYEVIAASAEDEARLMLWLRDSFALMRGASVLAETYLNLTEAEDAP